MGCYQAKISPTGPTGVQYQHKELVDNVVIDGIKCAAHYPKGDGQFPVLVFIHGGEGADSRTIDHMVLAGFVVVDNMQDVMNGGASGGMYTNRIVSGLHPGVLRRSADTSTIGLVGHSRGGLDVLSWAESDYVSAHPEVKAFVTFNGPTGAGRNNGISILSLAVGGSKDWIAWPSKVFKLYRHCCGQRKVYIGIRGVDPIVGLMRLLSTPRVQQKQQHIVGESRAIADAFQLWLNHDSTVQHRLHEQLGEEMDLAAYYISLIKLWKSMY